MTEIATHLTELDKHTDLCNEAWAQGELDRFTGETLLGSTESLNAVLNRIHQYFIICQSFVKVLQHVGRPHEERYHAAPP